MIKKITAFLLSAFFLISISGCQTIQPAGQNGSPTGQPSAVTQQAAQPQEISFDYNLNDNSPDFFTKNDTVVSALEASPYYLGAQSSLNIPAFQKFADLKKAKVEEAEKLTNDLYNNVKTFEKALTPYRGAYLSFVGSALKGEKKLNGLARGVAQQFAGYMVKEQFLEKNFESIDTSKLSNPFTVSFLEYEKTTLALQLADTYYQDYGLLLTNAAQLSTLLENSQDANIQTSVKAFDNQMNQMGELSVPINSINETVVQIDEDLKQINTGEYNMAMASIAFVQENMADIKAKIATMKPSDQIKQEDIDFYNQYADLMVYFNDHLAKIANNMDKSQFMPDQSASKQTGLIPVASAGFSDYVSSAYNSFNTHFPKTAAAASYTWQGTKAVVSKAQTGVGGLLDLTGAATKSVFDVGFGIANGNSVSDVAHEIGGNFGEVKDNYDKGKSGSKILSTAGEYLHNVDLAAQEAAANATSKLVGGPGWTSWGVGHVARLTSSFFTTFGQGITKLANKESTAGDYAQGVLDVGLSLIGGSKVIFKGSQLLSGGSEALPLSAETAVNFIQRAWNTAVTGGLKGANGELLAAGKLTASEALALVTNSIEVGLRDDLATVLGNVTKDLAGKWGELIKDGGKAVFENLTGGLKESFTDFVLKDFSLTAAGVKDALITVLGKTKEGLFSPTEYFNNLFGTVVDDYIKEKTKEVVDENALPGEAPKLADLAGKWSQGQMTITDVVASDQFKQDAQKEGCDLSAIDAQKGKSQPISISLAPSGENGGMMNFTTGDGKTQIVPFTYADGMISASFTQQGATMNINWKVSEENNSYKVSGPMNIDYKGGSLKITADSSASKPLPPPPIVVHDVKNPVEPGIASPTADIGQPPVSQK